MRRDNGGFHSAANRLLPDVSPSVIQEDEYLGIGTVAEDGFFELR